MAERSFERTRGDSLAIFAGHWTLRGFGVWAVEQRATGRLIGRIGCFDPDGWPGFELAYTLARPFWGLGFAREGAETALRHARVALGRTEIISLIWPANAASIRVAESLGAVLTEEMEFLGGRTLVYPYREQEGRGDG